MQTARAIGLSLFQYASDHGGKYLEGKSSTEIFQQLIDQQYITDPQIFYYPMPGKTKATGTKLKPDNVCFDVTNGALSDDSDDLPLVFSTGYKIEYVPRGKAHLLSNGDPAGIAVCFKNNNAAFLRAQSGEISLFPPVFDPSTTSNFDSKGRIYRQLSPDGALP